MYHFSAYQESGLKQTRQFLHLLWPTKRFLLKIASTTMARSVFLRMWHMRLCVLFMIFITMGGTRPFVFAFSIGLKLGVHKLPFLPDMTTYFSLVCCSFWTNFPLDLLTSNGNFHATRKGALRSIYFACLCLLKSLKKTFMQRKNRHEHRWCRTL